MADNSTILEKLDGLVARFEEISTLITDPAVIADQKRYVKLTKEYKELDDLMKARKEYIQLLGNIEEAKNSENTNDNIEKRKKKINKIIGCLSAAIIISIIVNMFAVSTASNAV